MEGSSLESSSYEDSSLVTPSTAPGLEIGDSLDQQLDGNFDDDNSNDNDYDDDLGSFASSLSATDAIDVSDGGLPNPDRLIELTRQIPELAVTSLILSNNSFVNVDEVQKFNDDKYSNRAVITLAEGLKTHQTITNLDISENNLGVKGQSGIVALGEAIKEGKLVSIDLSNNVLLGVKSQRYDGIKSISKAIGSSSGGVLEELRLAGNSMHASAISWLGPDLTDCTLKILDLSDNRIGVDSVGRRSSQGVNSLIMGFASNTCQLKNVNLSENFLGNEECIMLSQTIPSMFSLKELDLSFNDIHAVGARHLADAVKFNDTIEYLNLGGNHIQDSGCGDIADALKTNETLETLVLAANDLTTSSCYYFLECLQENRVLVDLNIDENDNMDDTNKKDVMEWCHGNSVLIEMREDPDGFDLATKSKIVRDNLFIKVPQESKEVISRLVANFTVKNDREFYERVAHICPPDRKTMLRMTQNLLSLMSMNAEDRAIRLVQKNYRRMKERQRKEKEMQKREQRRFMKGKSGGGASSKHFRKGKLASSGNKSTMATQNIVVR